MEYNLIADAGSTKIDWIVSDDNGRILSTVRTPGLNALTATHAELQVCVSEARAALPEGTVPSRVYYYGAGCATQQTNDKVRRAIAGVFADAASEVNSDMLGAARALFGYGEGIACILGTGSNSCLYDGNSIVGNIPPLGYILGDEGSGTAIGKRFINDYFKGCVPGELFADQGPLNGVTLDLGDVLDNVYRRPNANRYLASFAPLVKKIENTDYGQRLLNDEFGKFMTKHVARYQNHGKLSCRFIGGIACAFADTLKRAGELNGIRIDRVIKSPAEGLAIYHSKQRQ